MRRQHEWAVGPPAVNSAAHLLLLSSSPCGAKLMSLMQLQLRRDVNLPKFISGELNEVNKGQHPTRHEPDGAATRRYRL